MTADLHFIAQQWIAQHGTDTPDLVRQWARDLCNAPTAVRFLEEIADAAETMLTELSAPMSRPADIHPI